MAPKTWGSSSAAVRRYSHAVLDYEYLVENRAPRRIRLGDVTVRRRKPAAEDNRTNIEARLRERRTAAGPRSRTAVLAVKARDPGLSDEMLESTWSLGSVLLSTSSSRWRLPARSMAVGAPAQRAPTMMASNIIDLLAQSLSVAAGRARTPGTARSRRPPQRATVGRYAHRHPGGPIWRLPSVLRAGQEAFNNRDWQAMRRLLDPDLVWVDHPRSRPSCLIRPSFWPALRAAARFLEAAPAGGG
jgi:hypothetical protein